MRSQMRKSGFLSVPKVCPGRCDSASCGTTRNPLESAPGEVMQLRAGRPLRLWICVSGFESLPPSQGSKRRSAEFRLRLRSGPLLQLSPRPARSPRWKGSTLRSFRRHRPGTCFRITVVSPRCRVTVTDPEWVVPFLQSTQFISFSWFGNHCSSVPDLAHIRSRRCRGRLFHRMPEQHAAAWSPQTRKATGWDRACHRDTRRWFHLERSRPTRHRDLSPVREHTLNRVAAEGYPHAVHESSLWYQQTPQGRQTGQSSKCVHDAQPNPPTKRYVQH